MVLLNMHRRVGILLFAQKIWEAMEVKWLLLQQ